MDFYLKVRRARSHSLLPHPAKTNATDSGLDLPLDLEEMLVQCSLGNRPEGHSFNYSFEASSRDSKQELVIEPGGYVWVPTGWCVEIPPGYEGQVRGRSGLAFKHGLTVGHVGTIDAGYRGEIRVALVNHGQFAVSLRHSDRIAQLVINAIPVSIVVDEVQQLSAAPRGEKGYGSSGR